MALFYFRRLAAVVAVLVTCAGNTAFARTAENRYAPPWSAPLVSGENITVPGVDNVPDLHGDINNPDLVIFFAGNQYMVVNELLRAFQKQYPQYQHVFAETLPPGILARQMKSGSLVIGNMRIRLKPDLFTAGRGRMLQMQKDNQWFSHLSNYARNKLAIMTYAGNPRHITGWKDLTRKGLRLCMPNPKWEGIAQHAIIPALKRTGGEALVNAIYTTKVDNGTTYLTHIHHRQTPMRIMAGQCDAGAVWYTEAFFHAHIAHHPTALVPIPDARNKVVTYTIGALGDAPHKQAARDFMHFIVGAKAQAIYRHYGFMPPAPQKP